MRSGNDSTRTARCSDAVVIAVTVTERISGTGTERISGTTGTEKISGTGTLSSEVIIGCQPQLTRRSHGINQAPGLFYRNQSGVRPVLPCYCCCVAAGIRATLLISQPSPGRRGIISISFDLSRFFFFFIFVLNLSMVVLTKFSIQKYFSAQIISIYLDFSFFHVFFMFSIFILFLFCFCFFCIFCQILSFFGEFLSICECVFAFDLGHTYATSAISS